MFAPSAFACGAIAYIVLLGAAWLTGNVWLDALAALALLSLFLLGALRRREPLAWGLWLLVAAALALLGARGNGSVAIDALPLMVNAMLCALFARTLRRGRQPLVARVIGVLEGPTRLALSRVAGYARGLTLAWALLLGAQAALLAFLAACAPDGALAAFGIAPPSLFSGAGWRAYLHFGSYALVPAFFGVEYAFRRWYLRHIPHAPLPRFMAQLARRWPSLLRSLADDAGPAA
jgi:uncharacterized membrane protein